MFGAPAWTTLAAIVAILATCLSGIGWLVNKVINTSLMPLSNKIENLIESLNRLNTTFNQQQTKIEEINKRLDGHDQKLAHDDERISNLNREVYGNEKD